MTAQCRHIMRPPPDLWPFELKIGTPVASLIGKVCISIWLLFAFIFELRARRDERTDRQTGGTAVPYCGE